MKNIQNQLFWITIIFFAIGMIHITFSIIGLLCFIMPFVLYFKYRKKLWCKNLCPRAGYFNKVVSKVNLGLKPPKLFTKIKFKNAVVTYFGMNLFFVTMSTIMVTLGRIDAIEQIRFLIVFPLNVRLPQLLDLDVISPLVHLGYRVYSMMFTSVIIGTLLGIIYKPRTWCAICPVNTLTRIK